MLSENHVAIAKVFGWQKYCSYEKLLRIAAYGLRLLPKNSEYRTIAGAITDPAELENAEQRLFYLTQAESFQVEKSNLLKSTPLSKTSELAQFSLFRTQRALQSLWSNKRPRRCNLRCETPHSVGRPTSLGSTLAGTHARSTLSSRC